MSKSQFYLSQCAEAASRSPMNYTLGAILIKGGKVISSGYNHHRMHYDDREATSRGSGPGHGNPASMHAEMHAIFNATKGWSPTFKRQIAARNKKKEQGIPVLPSSSYHQAPPLTIYTATSFSAAHEDSQHLPAGPRHLYP
jgi:hypothetical protein